MDRRFQRRVLVLVLGMTVALSLLSSRLIYLHVARHDESVGMVEREHVKRVDLPADRGSIYDRTGELLAGNESEFKVVADRVHLASPGLCERGLAKAVGLKVQDVRRLYSKDEMRERYLAVVVHKLAPRLGLRPSELAGKLGAPDRVDVVLRAGVPEGEAAELERFLEVEGIAGIRLRETSRRFHPRPRRLAHVLGFLSHEGVGADGLEASFDDVLRGTPGYRYYEKDGRQREVAAFRRETREPVHGDHLRLAIDIRLQEIVEDTLDEVGSDPDEIWVPLLNARKVSVVLMDPWTGEVLAMANRPQFDLEAREGEWTNHAISSTYEPGSTFKIVTFGGVFDRGLVSPMTEIDCRGPIQEWKGRPLVDHHPYETLRVNQILAKSSNIGTYKLARQLGRRTFLDYVRAFGFGERTGVRLPQESAGTVWDLERWSGPTFSRMPMGYQVGVTPLQMVAAVSAVANGGELLRPRVVNEIVEAGSGRVVERFERTVVRRVMSEKAADRVRKAMIEVVGKGGTAGKAAMDGYQVAGKTGTAERFDAELGRYHGTVVSFMGFLPAGNPRFAGIVVIDDPRNSPVHAYGGSLAAPVFKRIAERAVDCLGIPPTGTIVAETE